MAHSLATATGTLVESSSKHIVPCRVATDYLTALISSQHAENAGRELQVLTLTLMYALSFSTLPR